MTTLSARTAFWLFVSSIGVLAVLAYVADRSATRYAASEGWVSHTREVETQLAQLQAEIARASRRSYQDILLEDPEGATHQQTNFADVDARLAQIRALTADNKDQQQNFAKLQPLIAKRVAILGQSLAHAKDRPISISPELRKQISQEGDLAIEVNSLIRTMHMEEEQLLAARREESRKKYRELRVMLAIALIVVVALLLVAFGGIRGQLALRTTAEQTVRKLSRHLLQVQDEERKRLSRELHDSIGQLFVGLEMELASLAPAPSTPESQEGLERCRAIVGQGLSETRTISHLLHPPMLEEMGFEHAAKWYVEGFSARSKIHVDLRVSQPFARLPKGMELVLYRFLQEALTNVHRHSGSTQAQISVHQGKSQVEAEVRDFGRGIRPDVLQMMQESSAGTGVGLGGMRERAVELGGSLRVTSGSEGTTVAISIPLRPVVETTADGDPWVAPAQKSAGSVEPKRRADASGLSLAISV
jgi:signal transduction histidine kinase